MELLVQLQTFMNTYLDGEGGVFMEKSYTKIYTTGATVPLKIVQDISQQTMHISIITLMLTTLKARTKEAEEVAQALVGMYLYDTVIDTIVCMEGTEVIGAFLAEELAKGGFLSTNAHKSIYVISPEFNNNSQIIFRDNLIPMIRDKHVMILMASVTTGRTLNKAVESIQYYGGILQGASAIFSAMDSLDGVPIKSVFGKKDLPDYTYSDYRDCPLCKAGKKIDALVNTFGYSPMG